MKTSIQKFKKQAKSFLVVAFCLYGFNFFAQPRFFAANFAQMSSITAKTDNFPKQKVENYKLCFTALGIGEDRYIWADASILMAVIGELAGDEMPRENEAGYSGYDGGFLSMAAGKQLATGDNYTFGMGFDFDARGLGSAANVQKGMYTIGPSMCLQYRPNKILTIASIYGFGWGTGFEMQWRNSISVGFGKLGINIQPNFNMYRKKDFTDPSIKWKISSKFLQVGISVRLD